MQEMHQHEEMHAAEPARQPLIQFSRDSICVSRKMLLTVVIFVGVFALGMLVSSGINNAGKGKVVTKSRAEEPSSVINSPLEVLSNPVFEKYKKDPHFVLFSENEANVFEGRFLALAHVDEEFDFKKIDYSCLVTKVDNTWSGFGSRNFDGFNSAAFGDLNQYFYTSSVIRLFDTPDYNCESGYILFYQSLEKNDMYVLNVAKMYSDAKDRSLGNFLKMVKNKKSEKHSVILVRIPFREFAWSKMYNGTFKFVTEEQLKYYIGEDYQNYLDNVLPPSSNSTN